jgi:hypothetical protein
MAKRKLDGCRRQWHMVTLADDVDPCHAFENPHWRWLIIIFCSRRSTGRQNSRVEWAANQQRKTLLLGEWQEIVETVLLKQRVYRPASRKQSNEASLAKRTQGATSLIPTPMALTTPDRRSSSRARGTRNTRAPYGVGAGTVQRFLAAEASAMGWSMDRRGIRTLFDHESKRLKQVELSGPRRERVSLDTYQTNLLPARSNSVREPNMASGPNQDHCAEHSPGFGERLYIPGSVFF